MQQNMTDNSFKFVQFLPIINYLGVLQYNSKLTAVLTINKNTRHHNTEMNMTLREYLSEYQAARSGKNNIDFSHHSGVTDHCEHDGHFVQKLANLKKIIKKYVKDIAGMSLIQRELEEIKNWLTRTRKMSRLKTSENETMISNVTRKSTHRASKQQFTPIPVIPIHDETLDDLRITNMTNIGKEKQKDKEMSRFSSQFCGDSRIEIMRVESEEQIFDNGSKIQDQAKGEIDKGKKMIGLKSPKNQMKINSKVFKAYSKQYTIQMSTQQPPNYFFSPPTPTLPPARQQVPTLSKSNRIQPSACTTPPSLKPMSQLTPSSPSISISPPFKSAQKTLISSPPQLIHLNTLVDPDTKNKEEQDSFMESVYDLPTHVQLVISR